MLKKPSLVLISIIFLSQISYGQLINRSKRSYINYGWVDFKNYREIQPIFPRFDYLGNFLVEGYDVYRWEEYRTLSPLEGSLIIKGRMFQDWLHHLTIANDAFAGWSFRLSVGDALRTTFTPLTLDLVRLNGVRFDMASERNQFTMIASRVSDALKLDPVLAFSKDWAEWRSEGVHLLGGHWESKFLRNHLTIGATLVNMYRFDSLRRLKENSLKGVALRDAIPDTVLVRFTDDSPEDGVGGAAVFSIFALAKVRTDNKIVTVKVDPIEVSTSPGVIQHPHYLEASGQYGVEPNRIPVHITYSFPMPANTVAVEFVALVANDYRIYVRQSHHFKVGDKTIKVTDKYDLAKDAPFYPYFIIRRAEGNVRDMSNKKVIRFSYGMLTGLTTFGFNVKLDLIGFHLQGEFNKHLTHFQYPVLKGGRSRLTDMAYYLTVTKDLKPFTFGAELFAIGPKYNAYDYDPKGPFVSVVPLGPHGPKGPFWYFNDKRQIPFDHRGVEGYNNVYPIVDDNDDNDIWPDNWLEDWKTYTWFEFQRSDHSGIFPGLDRDDDQWPDYNVNNNTIPDWDEPFLQYFADPIEFQYGNDYNNNFIIDSFEDDLLPQYPYYKDEKGRHFFFSLSPWKPLTITVGSIDIHQIAGGGINKMTYGKFNLDYTLRKGKIWYEHKVKRVRDTIPNDWYQFVLQEAGGVVGRGNYIQRGFKDRLEMKNSLVHRGYFSFEYQPIKNLNIFNGIKYEFNFQQASRFSDGTTQAEDRIDFIGLVTKVDYTFRHRNLTIMPRLKNRWHQWSRKSLNQPFVDKNLLIPILRADYRLTPRTSIRLGIQGFPLFESRLWDRAQKDYSYKERDFIILVSNTTNYQGYKVVWELGWEYTYRDFKGPNLIDDNYSRYFIRIHAGIGVVR